MVTLHLARCAKRCFVRALVIVALLSMSAAALGAEESKPPPLKISVAVGPAFALGKAAETWARLVAQRTGDALPVRVFPGATLAQRDAAREFIALREGAADMAVGSSLFWSNQVPPLAVASLPWIAPDPRGLAALASGDVAERLLGAVGHAGVVALAIAPLGHRELITLTDRVHAPADMTGLRVRIQSTPLLSDFYAALGASPVAMPLAAARAAVQTGNLDAQEGTPLTFAAARLDAWGFKFVTVWQAIGELAVFAVNRKTWDRLTAEQQSIVRDAARDAAHELAVNAPVESESALESLRQRGVTITRLLAPAQPPFVTSVRAMTQRWAETIGPELVDAARAAVRSVLP